MSREEREIRDDLFEVQRTRGFPTTNTRCLFAYRTIVRTYVPDYIPMRRY
jgi:hypothetical protein